MKTPNILRFALALVLASVVVSRAGSRGESDKPEPRTGSEQTKIAQSLKKLCRPDAGVRVAPVPGD